MAFKQKCKCGKFFLVAKGVSAARRKCDDCRK